MGRIGGSDAGWRRLPAAAILGLCVFFGWWGVPAKAAPDLWVARDGDSTITLFGSLHLSGRRIIWRDPTVDGAMARSQSLWLETDPPANVEDFEADLVAASADPSGGLIGRLTPDEAQDLDRLTRKLGLKPERLARLRPWAAATLLVQVATAQAGYRTEGIEAEILREGQIHGKPIGALEPAEIALRVFASLPEVEGLALLKRVVADLNSDAPQFERLVTAWQAGDEARIEAIGIGEMRATNEQLYRRLIVERNKAWLDRFDLMMLGRGEHFVAVGILHLVGPDRLQDHLVARGYTLERMTSGTRP